jgi:hypothetical protein
MFKIEEIVEKFNQPLKKSKKKNFSPTVKF